MDQALLKLLLYINSAIIKLTSSENTIFLIPTLQRTEAQRI